MGSTSLLIRGRDDTETRTTAAEMAIVVNFIVELARKVDNSVKRV